MDKSVVVFEDVKLMLQAHFVRLANEFKNEKFRIQAGRNPKNADAIEADLGVWLKEEITEFQRKLDMLKQNKEIEELKKPTSKKGKVNVKKSK